MQHLHAIYLNMEYQNCQIFCRREHILGSEAHRRMEMKFNASILINDFYKPGMDRLICVGNDSFIKTF